MAKRKNERSVGQRHRWLMAKERELWTAGLTRVAGVDEAGMGPLAGPVVAAAVIFRPGDSVRGADDSKQLTAKQRDELAREIRGAAWTSAVACVEPEEIDRLNIYHAANEAMRRAVAALDPAPQVALIDGNRLPQLDCDQECIVKGDAKCHVIAAASILAKAERDRRMVELDGHFPGYGFGEHKGYPTAQHRDAIKRLGPCPQHRRSFTLLPQPRLFE